MRLNKCPTNTRHSLDDWYLRLFLISEDINESIQTIVIIIILNLGNREIGLSNRKLAGVQNHDGTTTITDTLRYAFQADDHGQVLRCLTNGPWLNVDDQHDAFALLNVIGK